MYKEQQEFVKQQPVLNQLRYHQTLYSLEQMLMVQRTLLHVTADSATKLPSLRLPLMTPPQEERR